MVAPVASSGGAAVVEHIGRRPRPNGSGRRRGGAGRRRYQQARSAARRWPALLASAGSGRRRAPRRPIRGVRASLARPPRPPARRTGCGFGRCHPSPCNSPAERGNAATRRPACSRVHTMGYARRAAVTAATRWPVRVAPVPAPGRRPLRSSSAGAKSPGARRGRAAAPPRRGTAPPPRPGGRRPGPPRRTPGARVGTATRRRATDPHRPPGSEAALGQGAGLRIRPCHRATTASWVSAKPARARPPQLAPAPGSPRAARARPRDRRARRQLTEGEEGPGDPALVPRAGRWPAPPRTTSAPPPGLPADGLRGTQLAHRHQGVRPQGRVGLVPRTDEEHGQPLAPLGDWAAREPEVGERDGEAQPPPDSI